MQRFLRNREAPKARWTPRCYQTRSRIQSRNWRGRGGFLSCRIMAHTKWSSLKLTTTTANNQGIRQDIR